MGVHMHNELRNALWFIRKISSHSRLVLDYGPQVLIAAPSPPPTRPAPAQIGKSRRLSTLVSIDIAAGWVELDGALR